MDRNYVIENQLVDRYLRGDLSGDESTAFEEFYLSDQETLAELELAEKLEVGLKAAAEQGRLEKPSRHDWLVRAVTSPQWAAAASVLLVLSLGYNGMLQRQLDSAPNVAAPQLVPLIATRSATPATVISNVSDDWVVLLVDPGFEPYSDYRATVLDRDGETLWVVGGLRPGYEDFLAVGVDGTILQPGRYDLVVQGRSVSGDFAEISRTAFEVIQ